MEFPPARGYASNGGIRQGGNTMIEEIIINIQHELSESLSENRSEERRVGKEC